MRYTKDQLKDYIANNDLDIQVVKVDCKTIIKALEAEKDITFANVDVVSAVLELQDDPYFKKLKADLVTA